MKNLLSAVTLVTLSLGSVALAANQQVDPDTYRSLSPTTPVYGRSDGLYYDKTRKSPVLVGNGDGFYAIGPTYSEPFDYSDGQGLVCQSVARLSSAGYTRAASANQACNTTCGTSVCVAGFEAALTDAGDILGCSDATADACICQTAPLDEVGLCGADWESPSAGISLVNTPRGVALGAVALAVQEIGPDQDSDGLDIGADQADDNGFEVFGGMYGATGRPLVPSVDPAFGFCVDVKVTDLSGTDELWVGFRDTTAPNITFNSYNSYAVIGVDNTTGDVHTETEDDGSGLTTTDVTAGPLAEDVASELCVLVSDTGVVTYTFDGVAPTDAVAYTLDAGEPVIPFVHYLHSSDVADEVLLTDWEVFYQ